MRTLARTILEDQRTKEEHPAGVCSCGATRGDLRSSAVSKWFFRSLRGWKLLLSFICQRSIQRIHLTDDVLLSGTFRPPCGLVRCPLRQGQANEVQVGMRSRRT
jgi:hypothetical protein